MKNNMNSHSLLMEMQNGIAILEKFNNSYKHTSYLLRSHTFK